ncbi:MAG TPA: hypothetical protein VGM88_28480 [Kofleriaceae bacterium]|jgi:putative zinc finger/helix-turn-helix YgiT family protein
MKCTKCGEGTLKKFAGDHVYRESGMEHVILRNVTKYECEHCHDKSVEIPRMAQLHRLLAEILVRKAARLVPSEVRFLRDHLDLTNKGFAALMGVTEPQASRWTTTETMGVPAEHFLRTLATFGPFVLATEERAAVEMMPTKPLAETIHAFPSRDAEAKATPMRIRRSAKDWQAEVIATA